MRADRGRPLADLRTFAALLLILGLAACATPATQPPMTPPPEFAGPAVEAGALVMDDGARLPLARWTPETGEQPWAVIVALHGMNDSRAAFRLAGPWWAERGIETWAIDQRGFGAAPGRGVWAGQARMTEDLRTAVALARAHHPGAIVAVVGESMGGAVAVAAFASDRPPDADRLVLLAPAVWGWTAQGPFNSAGLWIAARAMGDRAVDVPEWAVRDRFASDNRVELFRNGRDPNSIISTRFDALYGLVGLMETASMQLGAVRETTLLLYGARDAVIQKDPMRRALARAGQRAGFRSAYYPEGWHLLNRDLQAGTVYRDVEIWLRNPAAPLPSGAGPVLPALQREPRP